LANLPVIFLLNPDQPASDYISEKNNLSTMLTKPFTPDQLMTAIRSLLKRSNLVLQDKILRYKELSMDLTTYQVLKKDKSIRWFCCV
jgi:two-component system phosphate regulon response regulator PhoB